jgi:capsular polysaccharide biosynthesis protein
LLASLRTVTVTEDPWQEATRTPESPPEPEFRGPLESALRNPLLVLIPIVLFVGAAVALGLLRPDNHEAEARVSVGSLDVPAFTFQGVVTGNAVLASGYARLISAQPVVDATAREAGVTPDEVRDTLRASNIANSTIIRVEADDDLEGRAIAIANAGAEALIDYVEQLYLNVQGADDLLDVYENANKVLDRRRADLQRALDERPRPPEDVLDDARAAVARSELRLQRLAGLYRSSAGERGPAGSLVVANAASEAESDRWRVFGQLVLIGLGAGLVVGLGLALLRENGRLLRRRR